MFVGKIIELHYHNPQLLEYGSYQIDHILVNQMRVSFSKVEGGVIVPRELIKKQDSPIIQLDVYLKAI